MARMPQYLRAMNLYIDGRGYAGQIEELSLPKLALKTEEYRGGGLDLPLEIDLGMEKLECEFQLNSYEPALLRLWGVATGRQINMTLRGAIDEGGVIKAVVILLHGSWKGLDMGTWKAGEKSALKVQVMANYYQLQIDGATMIEIDVLNMVRRIGEQDSLQAIRVALGL